MRSVAARTRRRAPRPPGRRRGWKAGERSVKKRSRSIRRLLRWAKGDRVWLILSVVCAFLSGLFVIGPYLGLYHIMAAVLGGVCTQALVLENALFILATSVCKLVLLAISGTLSHKGAYRALFRVRCMVTEHLAKVPLGALDERGTGQIKTVLNEDVEKLELFLAHSLPELGAYLTGPVVIFIYLTTVNVPLALVSLAPLALAVVTMAVVYGGMNGMMAEANASLSGFNGVMIEYISGMRLIKAYNMGSGSFKKFSDAIDEENRVWNKISKKMGPPYAAFNLLLESGMLLLVPLGGSMLLHGAISAGVLLLFVYVGSMYLTGVLALQQLGNNFAAALNGVDRVGEILDLPTCEGGGDFPENRDVELRGVRFSYDGRTDVLQGCDLKVAQGEKLALVGPSGAGKSTIVQLISRFYDATGGEVLIGGKNVRDIGYDALLAHISIVFQKTFLTRDSVLENIRMGSAATLDQVREAAKKAQIDDFIMGLPRGYDTEVGAFGSRFSGGERQRIAIARAILKNAPILILDEATSAADPENQVEIDRAIENLCRGKTVLIVAHRLGVVRMCDRVAVVEDRTVKCVGTHGEVLEQSGYYRSAWAAYGAARTLTYGGKGGVRHEA